MQLSIGHPAFMPPAHRKADHPQICARLTRGQNAPVIGFVQRRASEKTPGLCSNKPNHFGLLPLLKRNKSFFTVFS